MADENFTLVSVLDPGIDTARMPASEMIAYIETRDEDKIRPYYKPGAYVTEYRCREVPHSLWERYVMAGESEAERYRRAFQAGVMSVKNLLQRDGVFLPDVKELPRVGDVMADEAAGRFSPAERAEIGLVIWARSFLAPRTAQPYQLPPTVRACAAARDYLPVASSPSSQATSSDAASSPSDATPATQPATGSSTATCGDGSAPATGATATERTTAAPA